MDGMPVADILAALIPYASADGSNDAKRLDELVVGGVLGPAERFDVIYSLLFDPDGPLELVARRPGVDAAELSVTRLTRDARREVLLSRYPTLPRSMDDLLRSATLNEETAYLYIGSFATFSMNIDYDQWLRGEFEKINASGAENLVVDLRDVAGGMDDAATLLLRHLLSESVSVSQWENHTAYKRVPEAIRPHIRSWSNAFYDLSGQVTETTDGRFKARSLPEVQLVPAPDAFKGKVVVLVDATASSATFYLAKAIQESGVATLVGQQTGGSLKGLNAGLMVFLTLPNSGVVVDVPLFGSRPAEPGPDRGVYPDVLVEQEVEAIIAGRDLEVEAALRVFAGDR
jgi:C-terminal processing protease CtpA/Prc